ncbi:hypothetical protein NKH07_04365 [Mesorhizobium sp. M1378]
MALGLGKFNLPGDVVTDAQRVRSFGEKNGIDELTQLFVTDDNDLTVLGWELAAVMARICNAPGVYRSPRGEGASLYPTIKSISRAN